MDSQFSVPAEADVSSGTNTPRVIVSVKQFAERNRFLTEGAIRAHIFASEPRHSSLGEIPGNGLKESGALIQFGRRILIDEAKYLDWIASGRPRREVSPAQIQARKKHAARMVDAKRRKRSEVTA